MESAQKMAELMNSLRPGEGCVCQLCGVVWCSNYNVAFRHFAECFYFYQIGKCSLCTKKYAVSRLQTKKNLCWSCYNDNFWLQNMFN